MGIIKKLTMCGLICLLSASMVACGSNANKEGENAATATEQAADTKEKKEVKDDTPIAKVGDVEILAGILKTQLANEKENLKMQMGEDYLNSDEGKQYESEYLEQAKAYYAENLINVEIAKKKAEELKLMPTDEEIEKTFKEQKDSFETEEEFKKALETREWTEDDLKDDINTYLITQKISTYIGKDVKVTDEETKKYYDDNIAKYTTKSGATISHILVATEAEAKKVKAEYDAGTSFADLAKKYGTDGTKDMGGSLGYIEYDTQSYDADFMAAAKKLGEGEVSDPVKTQFGYHIIKVEGIQKDDVVKTFDEVKEQASQELLSQKQSELINTTLQKWRDEIGVQKFDDVIANI